MSQARLPIGKGPEWVAMALWDEGGKSLRPKDGVFEELVSYGPKKQRIIPFTTEWLSDAAVFGLLIGVLPGGRSWEEIEGQFILHSSNEASDFSTLKHHLACGFLVGLCGGKAPLEYGRSLSLCLL